MKSRTAAMGRYKPLDFGSVKARRCDFLHSAWLSNKDGEFRSLRRFPQNDFGMIASMTIEGGAARRVWGTSLHVRPTLELLSRLHQRTCDPVGVSTGRQRPARATDRRGRHGRGLLGP